MTRPAPDLERFDRPRPAAEEVPLPAPEPPAPEPPAPDPALIEAEALASLSRALSDAADGAAEALARAERARTAAFAEAVAGLLPALADDAFAAEVAAASRTVLETGRLPSAELRVSKADHPRAEQALAALGEARQAPRVILVADPALVAGEARLAWPDGGADFDREALIAAARARLRALASPSPTDGDDA